MTVSATVTLYRLAADTENDADTAAAVTDELIAGAVVANAALTFGADTFTVETVERVRKVPATWVAPTLPGVETDWTVNVALTGFAAVCVALARLTAWTVKAPETDAAVTVAERATPLVENDPETVGYDAPITEVEPPTENAADVAEAKIPPLSGK